MIQNKSNKIQEFRWSHKLSAILQYHYPLMLGADDGIL